MIPTARGPQTRPWLALLLCGLAGCQTAPAVVSTPAARPPPMMWLCGHAVPAEAGAVRAEVLRHAPAGTPVEAACARMEELGFSCLYPFKHLKKSQWYQRTRSLPELIVGRRDAQADKRFRSLTCRTSPCEAGNWGSRSFPLTVKLPFDEAGALTGEVEVTGELGSSEISPQNGPYAGFFSRRPELREPIGLPIGQARAVMQQHNFHCADVPPRGQEGEPRPYLDCYAYNENPLGGNIVRVHLFYDANGTVSEVEVVRKPGDFDGLRCMLPHEGDTASGGLVKVALLPAKMGGILAIYGLEVAVFGILGGGIGLH